MNIYDKILNRFFSEREAGYSEPLNEADKERLKEIGREMGLVEKVPLKVEEVRNTDLIVEELITEAPDDEERIRFITQKLRDNPSLVNKLYREVMSQSEEGFDIETELEKDTGNEKDHLASGDIFKKLVNAIRKTPGDYNDIERFVLNYGQYSYIDTGALMGGVSTFKDFIVSRNDVSEDFLLALFRELYPFVVNISGSNRGPGEIALALLSPDITYADVGDLKIGGTFVEVKGEKRRGSGGGRLINSKSDHGNPDLEEVWDEYEIPDDMRKTNLVANAGSRTNHYIPYAQELEQFRPGAGEAFVRELLYGTFIYADDDLKEEIVDNFQSMDQQSGFDLTAKIAYNNYVNVLRGKAFDYFLLLNLAEEKSVAFALDEYEKYLGEHFKFTSLSFVDKMYGPSVQLTML